MLEGLKKIFFSFSNLILSIPFTYLRLSTFEPNEIKADWQPPGYVFGIVWPILYILFGIINLQAYEKNSPTSKIILDESLHESIVQTLWLVVTSNYGQGRTLVQYLIGLLIMGYLVIYSHFVRKPILKIYDLGSYLLYYPYSLWIIFAFILNLQIVIKFLF